MAKRKKAKRQTKPQTQAQQRTQPAAQPKAEAQPKTISQPKEATGFKIGEYTAVGYVLVMLSVFPLFFRNNYIDIQLSKYLAFRTATAAFLIVAAAFELVMIIRDRKKAAADWKNIGKDFLIFSALLALAVIISQLLTLWPEEAMSGESSRRMGTVSWLLCVAAAVLLAVRFRLKKWLLYALAGISAVIVFIGILNFWGADPLGMYENLVSGQHSFFLGTIGNKNVTSNYLCLIAPAALAGFYLAKDKKDRIIAGSLAALAIYEGFAASSDSFLIGCFGLFLALLWHSLESRERMGLFWKSCLLFYGTAVVMKITLAMGGAAGSQAPFFIAFPTEGLIAIFLRPSVLAACGVVLLILSFGERKGLAGRERVSYPGLRRILFTALAVAAAAVIILIFFANVRYGEANEAAPAVLEKLIITDDFGSNRGYIWKRSIAIFRDFSWKEKIFGCGPDCFFFAAAPVYGPEMIQLYGGPFTDAHCEFLQILITTGIAGMIGYFGILIGSLVICLRSLNKKAFALAGAAVLSSYLLQGIVNNPTVTVTPILFTFVGVLRGVLHANEFTESSF